MGEQLRKSLENAPVVRFEDYAYFVHPLTDGVPEIRPELLRDVVDEILAVATLDGVTRIVAPEAMGIPVGTALSLATGIPLTILRKRTYGLPGEFAVNQVTGYGTNVLYANGVSEGDRVFVVDDVVSTGGTLAPILEAFQKRGVIIVDVVVLIEKGDGRKIVEERTGVPIKTLQRLAVEDGRVRLL